MSCPRTLGVNCPDRESNHRPSSLWMTLMILIATQPPAVFHVITVIQFIFSMPGYLCWQNGKQTIWKYVHLFPKLQVWAYYVLSSYIKYNVLMFPEAVHTAWVLQPLQNYGEGLKSDLDRLSLPEGMWETWHPLKGGFLLWWDQNWAFWHHTKP